MKFAKYVFWSAAMYGILVTFPLYFNELKMGLDYPPPINHAEYYYSFAGVTLVWQVVFVFIAIDPARYRSIMIACILEKLSPLPTFCILSPQGRFPSLWVPLIIIDFAFAILFFMAFKKVGRIVPKPNAG
jgi:hypothetical protein